MKLRLGTLLLGAVWLVSSLATAPTFAEEKVNCANEFRSGKLYFSQAQQQHGKNAEEERALYKKSVEHYEISVEVCPDKWDYQTEYGTALAQYAGLLLEDLIITPPPDSASIWSAIDTLEALYVKAGAAFQSAYDLEDRPKARKRVRERREKYWVDRYNHGLKLLKEEKFAYANVGFRWARHIDPTRPNAYRLGANALINLGQKPEAAVLVKAGLEQEPEDEKLNQLLEKIFIDAANDLTIQAEKESDAAKAQEAIDYLDEVLERRGGEDENVLFKRGTAYMALGASLDMSEGVDERVTSFQRSAADYAAAAELVSFETDRNFHLAALFNEIQSFMKADDCDAAIEIIKDFISKDHTDPAVWQSWAICLSQMEDPQAAVAALMLSKSLAGSAIDVEPAMENAVEDAAASIQNLGRPDFIRAYQESSSGNQIESWFWIEKRTAISFILGVNNGEVTW